MTYGVKKINMTESLRTVLQHNSNPIKTPADTKPKSSHLTLSQNLRSKKLDMQTETRNWRSTECQTPK